MVIKRLIYAFFIAFLASAATIGILARLARETERENASRKARPVFPEELARHAAPADCWMAIEGNVYDLTGYIPAHPTAPEVVTRWCGKEATEAFKTKGRGAAHSPAARAMLERYFVGKLENRLGIKVAALSDA